MIQDQGYRQPAAVHTVVNIENHMGVEDRVETKPTTSVNLSEIKRIIFLSICLPESKDREVKNLKGV